MNTILEDKADKVESYLADYFDSLACDDLYPKELLEACRYSLLAGGKRLRPALVFLINEMFGGSDDQIAPLAGAIELIHSYSLVHDDLPAMDNDALRRGKPTCHVKYGEALAILCGDGLLTEAFRMLSYLKSTPASVLEIYRRLAGAAGLAGMVTGQAADLNAENRQVTLAELDYIHRHKTGAMIEASVVLPGIANGATSEQIESLSFYGKNIGLAFQIVDDVLDVVADQNELGKPVGSDKECGKSTYVSFFGVEEAQQKADAVIKDAKEALSPFGDKAEPLLLIADYIVARKK